MAKKLTKRKQFSFLRSYFDVLNELQSDKDKLNFLLAVINKQFLDEDPEGLNFLVNLCYESQRHQIETSVKGWKRATNDTLGTTPPTPLGTTPPTNPKEEEEEEKEEEKEENVKKGFKYDFTCFESKEQFLLFFNAAKKHYTKSTRETKLLSKTDLNNLEQLNTAYNLQDFKKAINAMSKSEWVKQTKNFNPAHFLRVDNFNKYLNAEKSITKAAYTDSNV